MSKTITIKRVEPLSTKSLDAIIRQSINIKNNLLKLKDNWDGTSLPNGLPSYYQELSDEFSIWLGNIARYAEAKLGKHIDYSKAKYVNRMEKGAFIFQTNDPLYVQYEGLEEYAFSNLVHIGRAMGQSILGNDYWNPKD